MSSGTPTGAAHALFDTRVGTCAIAWSARGIRATRLPAPTAKATLAAIRAAAPGEAADPPPHIALIVDRLRAVVAGEAYDSLLDVPLDLHAPTPFAARVYAAARQIPPGSTVTYGVLAIRLGVPAAARAVGAAMAHNPVPIVIPCHRVVAASGIGGFTAPGGAATKAALLAAEIQGATLRPSSPL